MSILNFAVTNARWIGAGAGLAFCSAFGQTFFISLFNDAIRADYGLSNAAFGTLYAVATLASAATLVPLGRAADRVDIGRTVWLFVSLLGLAALAMALLPGLAPSALGIGLLGLNIYALRLFGQGMSSHFSMTLMAKWFAANRGRAIGLAALGLPLAEATFPRLSVWVSDAHGWRAVWLIGAVFLLVVAAPLIGRGVGRPRVRKGAEAETVPYGLTRRQVLRRPSFYLVVIGLMSFGFAFTGVFFTQNAIVAAKDWPLELYASAFVVYAAMSVTFMLIGGVMVDRFGAIRLIPYNLLPGALGLVLLASIDAPVVAFVFLGLGGVTMGFNAAVTGALWAEIYGTKHLGSIRAVISASMVFATALAPVMLGFALDAGVPVDWQIGALAALLLAAQGLLAVLSTRLVVLARDEVAEIAPRVEERA